MLHKFTRKAALAISYAEQGKDTLKKLNRLFRSTRAPFSTSQHGKLLQSARRQLAEALEKQDDLDEMLEMWFLGICRDRGIDESTFTRGMLVDLLKKKAGELQQPFIHSLLL